MEPAYEIPLRPSELEKIGKLCAIQGQIEHLLRESYQRATGCGPKLASKVLQSNNLRANAEIWLLSLEHYKHVMPSVDLDLAHRVLDEITQMTEGRNDFVHAVFGYLIKIDLPELPAEIFVLDKRGSSDPPVGKRTRSEKTFPATAIDRILDRASWISRAVADINHHCVSGPGPSPWHDKLST